MTTICADELFPDAPGEDRRETARRAPAAAARRADAAPAPATRRRHEDFETRGSRLGDLMGGHVFPRRP